LRATRHFQLSLSLIVGREAQVMQKYRVIVRGQNLLTEVDGVRQRVGFFTNVFVEALTPTDAELRAVELIREDARLRQMTLNAESNSLRLSAGEVQEIESFDGVRLPRTGLALYPEKSEET
jgi:hypothetical protein